MLPDSLTVTIRKVAEVFQRLDSPYALLGGIAVSMWSQIRTTQDIDAILSVPITQQDNVVAAFSRAGFRPRRQPPRIVHLDGVDLVQFDYQLPDTFVEIGVDLQFAKSDFHQVTLDRRVPQPLPGTDVEVNVVACEDLILLKLLAGRMIDLADAAYVLRFNAYDIDLEYLQRWARQLHVRRELTTIWDEAFPGFAPPLLPPPGEDL